MATERRVTISQQPSGPEPEDSWEALVDHVTGTDSDLVVLPEMPFDRWLPATDAVDARAWEDAAGAHDRWLDRFDDLAPAAVLGSRPVLRDGRRWNEAFLWTPTEGYRSVHRKVHLPEEAGFWEASWYESGPETFEVVEFGGLRIGFLICTELWAMERVREYGADGIDLLVTPRATEAATIENWLAAGRTAAIVAGAHSVSANRSESMAEGPRFGGQGWCFDPDGELLATTDDEQPFRTVAIDVDDARRAVDTYPRYAIE